MINYFLKKKKIELLEKLLEVFESESKEGCSLKLENISEIFCNIIKNRENMLHFDKIMTFLMSDKVIDILFFRSQVSKIKLLKNIK